MSQNKTTIHHFKAGDAFAEQGRFILEQLLGVGGFADVYRARDTWSGIVVALKIYTNLKDEDILSLSKEYARMAHLNHTNVLKADYFGSWNNVPYLMMQFCRGGSLDRLIGKLYGKDLLKMMRDVAMGLDYLHSRHIVHQDIKPANVLIDFTENNEPVYKLSDFGISNNTKTQLSKSINVANNELSLTVAYAPPEKFSVKRAEREPNPKGDIYSFGLSVYEIITETLPYGDISTGNQMYHYPNTSIDLSEIHDARLRWIVDKCVQRLPEERPTARQLIQMIDADESDIPEKYFSTEDDVISEFEPDDTVKDDSEQGLNESVSAETVVLEDKREELQNATIKIKHDDEFRSSKRIFKGNTKGDTKDKKEVKKEAAQDNEKKHASDRSTELIDQSDKDRNSDSRKRIDKGSVIRIASIIAGVLAVAGGVIFYFTRQSDPVVTSVEEAFTPEISTYYVDSLAFEMSHIPGGDITMVSGNADTGDTAEQMSYTVQPFKLATTEVTQELWTAVMGSNPSVVKGKDLPVNGISWDDCQTFIAKLNSKTGKQFYIPTEVEWEFAATTDPQFGGKVSAPDSISWYAANSKGTIHPVGSKMKNQFGLYDMSGNVIEWTQDVYSDYTTGKPLKGESERVLRGGYYDSREDQIKSNSRGSASQNQKSPAFGLRIALKE